MADEKKKKKKNKHKRKRVRESEEEQEGQGEGEPTSPNHKKLRPEKDGDGEEDGDGKRQLVKDHLKASIQKHHEEAADIEMTLLQSQQAADREALAVPKKVESAQKLHAEQAAKQSSDEIELQRTTVAVVNKRERKHLQGYVLCSDLVDVQYLVFPDESCMVRPLRIQTVKDSMALLKDGWGFGRMMLVLEIPERPGYYMVFDGVHRLAGIYQMQAAPHIYPQWAPGKQQVAIQVFDSKMPSSAMKRLGIAHTFRVREVGYSTHLSRERGDVLII
jgi:hypothetical protein